RVNPTDSMIAATVVPLWYCHSTSALFTSLTDSVRDCRSRLSRLSSSGVSTNIASVDSLPMRQGYQITLQYGYISLKRYTRCQGDRLRFDKIKSNTQTVFIQQASNKALWLYLRNQGSEF